MGRHKEFYEFRVPKGVADIAEAVISDYRRREKSITGDMIVNHVEENYIRLNAAVDRALACVEPGIRKDMMRDIELGRGYTRSPVSALLSKNAYYRRRRKLVYDVAYELALL